MTHVYATRGISRALETIGAWVLGVLWILPLAYAGWTAFHPPEFATRFVLDAPLTVENFVTLARKGFFDGLSIHRVVPDFVVQDGDPRGDGEGGPGYTVRDELNERPYLRGTIGMALDWADTGGSQFFITHSPQPHLDAKYTVFGRVIAGMEFLDQIQQWDVIRRVRVWDGIRPSTDSMNR